MSNKRLRTLSAAAVALLAVLAALYFGLSYRYHRLERYIDAHPGEQLVEFWPGDSFFEGTAQLEMSLPGRLGDYAEIRYTLDGSSPTSESPLYTGPITLDGGSGRMCFPVKAAVFQDGAQSVVYTKTYFPSGTAALSDGIVIVSLSGEPDDFYGDKGILALGAATPELANADPALPLDYSGLNRANYYGSGREWERPVTVEMLTSEGELILAQQAGIRVFGRLSRSNVQKSLRLYARREYDPAHGSFRSPLLVSGTTSDGSETPIERYDRIDLRNGGNDWAMTMLGDATMRMFAAEAGLAPVGMPRPAAVYINGAFYGLAWMQPDYCEKNIAEMCGLDAPENIRVVETNPALPYEGSMRSEEYPEEVADYERMYNLALADLTQPQNVRALEEALDVDNFLLYYAVEMYSGNMDWPNNNLKAWRYLDTEGAEGDNPYADGRWRFLFYDADNSYGTYHDQDDIFDRLIGRNESPMLASILRNEDYRDRFLNLWSMLLSGVFSQENVNEVIRGTKDLIEPELLYREQQDPDELCFDRSYRTLLYRKLEQFIRGRPAEIEAGIARYLGIDIEDKYTLHVTPPDSGGTVYVDGRALEPAEDFSCAFWRGTSVELGCDTARGLEVSGWQVDGMLHKGAVLRLAAGSVVSDSVTVQPVLTPSADAGLALAAVSYRNELDFVEVVNCGVQPLSTDGCTLVKNGGSRVYPLPAVTLGPGESLRVVDESSDSLTAERLGDYLSDLSLGRDDVLELADADGGTVDGVVLPARNSGMVYRRSGYSERWVWTQAAEGEKNG